MHPPGKLDLLHLGFQIPSLVDYRRLRCHLPFVERLEPILSLDMIDIVAIVAPKDGFLDNGIEAGDNPSHRSPGTTHPNRVHRRFFQRHSIMGNQARVICQFAC